MGTSVVRLLSGLLLALALCGGAFASERARPTQDAMTWWVVAGGLSQDLALDIVSYFPRTITINEGDTVSWTFQGFHTVSFLSGAQPPLLFVPGPDNIPMANPAAFAPAGGPTYDGTGFVNSGPPAGPDQPFSLMFSKAGTYGYICLIHPGQDGTVIVQPAGSAYPMTQEQASAQGNAELYSKIEYGTRLIQEARLTSKPAAGGRTNYTVLNGTGGNQVSVNRFLPVDVTIRSGDSVTWEQKDVHSIHTVTFFDTSGPPPADEFFIERPQPNGPPMLLFPGGIPKGGTSVENPKGFYNSGVQVPGQSYTFTFPKAGVYNYVCIIHAELGMVGKVTVQDAGAPAPGRPLPATGIESRPSAPSSAGSARLPRTLPETGEGASTLPLAALGGAALALVLAGALLARRRA